MTVSEIKQFATDFVSEAREKAKDGLTWTEFRDLRRKLVQACVKSFEGIRNIPGATKKAYVMDYAGWLFDSVVDRMIPSIFSPFWIFVRPAVRAWAMSYTSGLVEEILEDVRTATA